MKYLKVLLDNVLSFPPDSWLLHQDLRWFKPTASHEPDKNSSCINYFLPLLPLRSYASIKGKSTSESGFWLVLDFGLRTDVEKLTSVETPRMTIAKISIGCALITAESFQTAIANADASECLIRKLRKQFITLLALRRALVWVKSLCYKLLRWS